MKNAELSYDVDISKVGCGCNTNAYFQAMPTYTADGVLDKGDGDWYCDANDAKHLCPEMDTFEANKYTFATTAHTCDDPADPLKPHYTKCDGGGCQTNAYNVDKTAFGPGMKIDTNKTFRISHSMGVNSSGDVDDMNQYLMQDGKNW